jgi:UDP-glucose 4-epimerase
MINEFDRNAFAGKIGLSHPVVIDYTVHRKVLITGAHSYIGESFEHYAKVHYMDQFEIDTIDLIDGAWRDASFSGYDAVFHVAGIAHADVGNVSDDVRKKYYQVNTDLAIEVAQKAKNDGVQQFVFMSSMIIYGDSAGYGVRKVITGDTPAAPANFYGDSKWQADQGVRQLADPSFQVVVLRPPMIYGKGSKGNYPLLSKLAKKMPVFPNVSNERSMLHIDNLCEFLCKIMMLGEGGIFIPQNQEYTRTSNMVKEIAEVSGKKIRLTEILNPAVYIGSKMPGKIGRIVNKAFGNFCYDQSISEYEGITYQIVELKESILRTEGCENV